jgi:Arc/MetJ family transcription regulator
MLDFAAHASAANCLPIFLQLQCVFMVKGVHIMRTNIVIDDKLMKDTLRATGLKTKREAVDLGLRTVLRLRQQGEIRRFRGKLNWQGDLDAMRTDK